MTSSSRSPNKLFCGTLILPDRLLEGAVYVEDGRIAAVGTEEEVRGRAPADAELVQWTEGYIGPGYIDVHVHGGRGADFMDASAEAFETVLSAHAAHGTTRLAPTTTVASHERLLEVLQLCRQFRKAPATAGSRVVGCHFYGPYFGYEARGCHPGEHVRPPVAEEFSAYLEFADDLATATVAPELPGAEAFARACAERGVPTNVGHSLATFDQMQAAVDWGVRHVDHLYCAMSDKTKLRQSQAYPMRGGVLEATLYFDELTTEVIADGKHLSPDLLLLALKLKGPERLALCTDCNRALDEPDGEYEFGPAGEGEMFVRRDDVGVMPDGSGLASSVQGMDHMVRTFAAQTGRPLWEVVRMASQTPARILGREDELGSLNCGRRGDLLLLDAQLRVAAVYVDGEQLGIESR